MKFCIKCNNMYYITIDNNNEDKLSYYCRNCGHKDVDIDNEGVCVLNTHMKKEKQHFEHIINKYTKLDPTLPRIQNLPCPNSDCKTNKKSETNLGEKEVPRDVLYIRYDDNNLKYLYMCCICDNVWTR
jgi:DNA-directed RNA polymerase subunit M/transcription elongation factor TFIIS